MNDVSHMLQRINRGDPNGAKELLPLVYAELRQLAEKKMQGERADHSLQATALVHEAYVRLVQDAVDQQWDSRGHFYVAAAEAMRRILIENARRRQTLKRGGQRQRVELDAVEPAVLQRDEQLLELSDALDRLEKEHPRQAQVVKLRFFAGRPIREVAQILGVSTGTVDSDWAYARAWLKLAMKD